MVPINLYFCLLNYFLVIFLIISIFDRKINLFVIPERGCLFFHSQTCRSFSAYMIWNNRQSSVLLTAVCCETVLVFFAKDNSDRQKIKSRRIIWLKIPVRFFLFIYKTFNISLRKTQVLRRDSDFLKWNYKFVVIFISIYLYLFLSI